MSTPSSLRSSVELPPTMEIDSKRRDASPEPVKLHRNRNKTRTIYYTEQMWYDVERQKQETETKKKK